MPTQVYSASLGANVIVLEGEKLKTYPLDTRPEWSFGRQDPSGVRKMPDIAVSSKIVSRMHGWFQTSGGVWYFTDNVDNTNGTYHNGKKIDRPIPGQSISVRLRYGDVLRVDTAEFDNTNDQAVLLFFTTAEEKGIWSSYSLAGRQSVVIGRDPSCNIVEPLPYLSGRHCRIDFSQNSWWLTDCGSTAGTFLNGMAVTEPTRLHEKDCISLCDCSFFFLGNRLLYAQRGSVAAKAEIRKAAPDRRPMILRARIQTKQVKSNTGHGKKELIRDINIDIREGSLVALLGTAGAGKSTVMNCLNGMDLTGVRGSVKFRGVDLMRNFDQMKYLIGSVPQKKVFHPSFTPEEEFRQAAMLRLPADTSPAEIQARVDRTLEMLSMTGVRTNRNSKLSGGEQTRVNVGIELVADRDFLCLDEPDQGLSPNYKHELFEILRNLAHKHGKSVLSIIHDVSEIDLFDQVIMLAKVDGVGRLAFSGSPEQAREFFGCDIRDAYALLERDPGRFVR